VNNRRAPHCTAANDPWLREAVGAYLLGALDPAESDRVSAHLAGCASCRAEYGELAELLPLLASVTESEAVNGPVMPEPAVLGRVLASTSQQSVDVEPNGQIGVNAPQARPYRRRAPWRNPAGISRRSRFALAAAGIVVVAGGTVAGTLMASSGGLPAGSWTATASATGYPLHANVQVTPGTHGSKIQLKLDDVPAGYSCEMVVVGKSGKHETTGSWTANTEGSFDIPGWSSMAPNLISSIQVDLPDGSTLLTLNHPST
jgi:predicted anti-sigma-YlaC factor YlaD